LYTRIYECDLVYNCVTWEFSLLDTSNGEMLNFRASMKENVWLVDVFSYRDYVTSVTEGLWRTYTIIQREEDQIFGVKRSTVSLFSVATSQLDGNGAPHGDSPSGNSLKRDKIP
jgi:hypothetical protein